MEANFLGYSICMNFEGIGSNMRKEFLLKRNTVVSLVCGNRSSYFTLPLIPSNFHKFSQQRFDPKELKDKLAKEKEAEDCRLDFDEE